jgi:hypothetical protein
MNNPQENVWPDEFDETATGHGRTWEEGYMAHETEETNPINEPNNQNETEPMDESQTDDKQCDQRLFKTWGCPINTENKSKNTQIYFQNINGVGTRNLSSGFTTLYSHMKSIGVTLGMFAETNVDWKKHSIKECNELHGRRVFPNAVCAYSCHSEDTESNYKPGGTMMSVNGALAARHLESGTDPSGMGRFSYQTFTGRNNVKIIFITAYRVCFQNITTEPDHTHRSSNNGTISKQRGIANPTQDNKYLMI